MGRYLSNKECLEQRAQWKKEGKVVGLCHGVFDLLHVGHIVHFEEARKECDILIVSVTSAPYVKKGPGRPYFNDELRIQFLTALAMVDYVLLSEAETAETILSLVKPDVYFKGEEYSNADSDVTGNIRKEANLLEAYGGKIYFTHGFTASSSRLINNHFSDYAEEVKQWLKEFHTCHSFLAIKEGIENLKNTRVLVIGDVILDEYITCKVNGAMTKDRGLSVTEQTRECHAGGSLAVARHAAQFSDCVGICSIIGNEKDTIGLIETSLTGIKMELLSFDAVKTIKKTRYIDQSDQTKLFSVCQCSDLKEYHGQVEEQLCQRIDAIIAKYDVVILADFGHGCITGKIQKLIEDKAKYLAVNCQANSENRGLNLISKYHRADLLCCNQKELYLAMADPIRPKEELLSKLSTRLGGAKCFLTLASEGAVTVKGEGYPIRCPSFASKVKDAIGAGDAFLALASLCMANGMESDSSLFIASAAAALATGVLGNQKPVTKGELLKFISVLLNW